MTDPETPRRVEIKHDDQTVAAAEVAASAHGGRIARASLHSAPGHIAPGSRASLVDAVLNLPEVQASERLEAAVPLGGGEPLQRLREPPTRQNPPGRLHRAGRGDDTARPRPRPGPRDAVTVITTAGGARGVPPPGAAR